MSQNIVKVMRAASRAAPKEHTIALGGGLNTTASTVDIRDGEAIVMMNYEVNVNGNYQSVAGIERFDGQPAPSEVVVDRSLYETDEAELAAYIQEREARRALIEPVPGSGPVRGVYYFQGEVIAFRNTSDGLSCKMYRSTSAGWQEVSTPVLEPDGVYEFTQIHYGGRQRELAGVDGKNHGFLWDGSAFTQIINPGMDATGDDKPTHVSSAPAELLTFAYPGGSFQWSALGDPTDWDVANGAGEIALADDITGISTQANDVIAVFCLSRTYLIRGRTPSEWRVDNLYSDSGAVEGSIQAVGDSIYLDARGLTRLSRVQQFGDFSSQSLSARIHSLIQSAIPQITCSVTVNRKNQYRIFLNTGAGITATFLGDDVLFSQFSYGGNREIFCATSVRTPDRDERVFAGSTDGFVYELDRGASLDGDPIDCFLRTAYSTFAADGSMIGMRKRLTRMTTDVRVATRLELTFAPSIDYEDLNTPVGAITAQAFGDGGYWSAQSGYDESYWTTAVVNKTTFHMAGTCETVSAYIYSESDIAAPHVISNLTYRYILLDRRR